jgi:SAM-dependent methyltransferase
MHESAYNFGRKFVQRYATTPGVQILEIGAMNVNGSIRDFAPEIGSWHGVDLEAGPGVDTVIEASQPLPFDDNTFDCVIASSVFEHDPFFWVTIEEMARVVKPSGYVYINAPSNGAVHRFPVDNYRFYPDAGKAIVDWLNFRGYQASLLESFVGAQENYFWNDFVAVIGFSKSSQPASFIYQDSKYTNLWVNGIFDETTWLSETQDMTYIADLEHDGLSLHEKNQQLSSYADELGQEVASLRARLAGIHNSHSWKLTSPLRRAAGFFRS